MNQIESGVSQPPPAATVKTMLSKLKLSEDERTKLADLAEQGRTAWAELKGRGTRAKNGAGAGRGRAKRNAGADATPPAKTTRTRTSPDVIQQGSVIRIRVPVVPGAQLVGLDFVFERATRAKRKA